MSTTPLTLLSPLAGWVLPLAEVPDPVFAEGMAGDGLAIDPTGDTLHAPCDGQLVPMPGTRHAPTLPPANGVAIPEPKQPSWAKPTSSRTTTRTFGASGPGVG